MTARKLISIVTPCYNEACNVQFHFDSVCLAIEPFRKKYDFEHIYTDNCSEDETFSVLSSLASQNPLLRVIRFSRNIGANRAIFIGLGHAAGDAAILIQADLQDPPSLIPQFILGWEEGYDVVFGKIQGREEGTVMQTARKLYYKLVSKLSDIPIPENAGEFRGGRIFKGPFLNTIRPIALASSTARPPFGGTFRQFPTRSDQIRPDHPLFSPSAASSRQYQPTSLAWV